MRRYCYTIRDVNEARRPHTCSRPCAFEKKRKEKKNKKSAPSGTHHENHSSQATATNSRWRATKQGPRVSPYSPASIDPGFVEIGLVHLSQSVKTTNVTHTHTQTNEIMAPRTHPGTSREVNEERRPHTGSRPCAFEEKKTRDHGHFFNSGAYKNMIKKENNSTIFHGYFDAGGC